MMEWVLALTSGFVVPLLLGPLAVLLGALMLFGVIGHVLSGPTVSRTAFDCPFSKRRATVEFLIPPGAGQPSDVLSCSVFSEPYHVRCHKGCLAMAETGWMPSPMMPRYALLADGLSYRPVGPPDGPAPKGPPREGISRVA